MQEETQTHFKGVRNVTIQTASHTNEIPTLHFIFF